jgi:hypothetical protein
MTYRLFPYWLDEPNGFVWQVDDGDQEHGDTYREVRFEGVHAETVVRTDASSAALREQHEPKAWVEIRGAVLVAADGVATFRPDAAAVPGGHE